MVACFERNSHKETYLVKNAPLATVVRTYRETLHVWWRLMSAKTSYGTEGDFDTCANR